MIKFEVKRESLARVLNLMRPLVTTMDFKSITDSIYMSIKDKTLSVKIVGESVVMLSTMPAEGDDVTFLTNAQKVIHQVTHSNTDKITFTISGKGVEDGIGNVKVRGNSVFTLPLKRLDTYPEVVNFEKAIYTKIEDEGFLSDIILASGFVDKTTQNWKSGICISDSVIVSVCGTHGLFILKKLPIQKAFSARPDSFKVLHGLDNLVVGFPEGDENGQPNMVLFNGDVGDIPVYVGLSVFAEEYPYEQYVNLVKEKRKEPAYDITFDKDIFGSMLSRLQGIVMTEYPIVKMSVSNNMATFYYSFQEYESDEKIPCVCEDEFEIELDIMRLKEINSLSKEEICFQVSKESPVLTMVIDKKLYTGAIRRD